MIHFTFDGWTSRQNTSFLGINAHFIDQDWNQWESSWLCRLSRNAILEQRLQMKLQIQYARLVLKTESGTTRLTTLRIMIRLWKRLPLSSISTGRASHPLRPHFLNLADFVAEEEEQRQLSDAINELATDDDFCVPSMEEGFEVETVPEGSQDQDVLPDIINGEEVDKYRKFGPFGKLHNIGIALRTSSQLLEVFYEAQRQTAPTEPILTWVQNVCTRWMFSIIEERWLGKGGKEQDKPAILKEQLSLEEWKVVVAVQKILQPFKIASKQLQGEGIAGKRSTSGGSGVIIEENEDQTMKEVHLFNDMDARTRRVLKIYIKLGWKKLNDYYSKLTSTAYVAAVVFHPCKKWRALERLWSQLRLVRRRVGKNICEKLSDSLEREVQEHGSSAILRWCFSGYD
ncbi:ribonuclease H-like protein [Hirsutella rhossiliensis]|uniref:Ribonuclease H-like protein n=1 Tax=Hirsutella rhossiliensis TaxID=111463 RepID=A0A9P8MNR8_9HYPO|nr:Ribonuclease H-like protein [Hirsutella rhossiliensis]KAH0958389.1 Ribonuclease H-like protein [Hirsutella rhossiliensis]